MHSCCAIAVYIRVSVQHKGSHSFCTLPLCKWLSQKLQCQLRMSVTNGSYFCSGIRVTHTATHSATHTATHNVTRNALQQYVVAVCRNCYTYCCSTLLQRTSGTCCCNALLHYTAATRNNNATATRNNNFTEKKIIEKKKKSCS